MRLILHISVLIGLLSTLSADVTAQANKVYADMSLEELLDIDVVVTASKKPEDLFETPLSVSIIKKEEIERSGASCIPEALRLAQGMIVREITPGNYDVQIRGLGDITKNAYLPLPYSTTMLVMIDNRIVYSYYTGGTFWETFPIDINDVERIEIVRGPASALYGPNAVTGVINIITSQLNKKGWNLAVNGANAINMAQKASTNIGYNWNNKTKLSVSSNFDERQRFTENYFDYTTNTYSSLDNLSMTLLALKDVATKEVWNYPDYRDALGAYYDAAVSLKKFGSNLFLSHEFSEHVNLDIAAGYQNSQSQRISFMNFATTLSQVNSESYYVNARLKHKNFNGQLNMHKGEDLNNYKYNSYTFRNIDGFVEYYKEFKTLSFRPGLSYKHASYDSPFIYDEPFSLNTLNYQFKNDPRTISTISGSLLTEWKPNSRLRIIAAASIDKYSINKNYSHNFELATTYRINKNNLLRFVSSSAKRSPFIFDTYLNSSFMLSNQYHNENNELPIDIPIQMNMTSRPDLEYPSIFNNEVSWRTKTHKGLSIDVEVFYSLTNNLVVSNLYREFTMYQHIDETGAPDSINSINAIGDIVYENFDITAQQYGASIRVNYELNEKLQMNIFGTFQHTELRGKTEIEYNTLDVNITELPETNELEINMTSFTNPTQWSEKLTPKFYGGYSLYYNNGKKWSFNTNGYLYTEQHFVDYDFNNFMADYTGNYRYEYMDIEANLVMNAKIDYKINKHLSSYISIKNILGNHREYGYADEIGRLVYIGIKWQL